MILPLIIEGGVKGGQPARGRRQQLRHQIPPPRQSLSEVKHRKGVSRAISKASRLLYTQVLLRSSHLTQCDRIKCILKELSE